MRESGRYFLWLAGIFLTGAIYAGCSPVQEQAQVQTPPVKEQAKATKAEAKKPAVEVEGVISNVGQRTITFQHERKGKVREEVVGVDAKTDIEKGGKKVKLRDLQQSDKALIKYEPDAYTPAHFVKVIGTGKLKKGGGGD
ncbi:MAG: hypothetical protein ACREQK_12760 [Candidatus Binatia bacterium]